jgi:hypothetical protein
MQTFDDLERELARIKASSYQTETRREWLDSGYGNLKEKIILNPDGSRSNQLAIEKHGRVVNVMTSMYWVVPNRDILEVVKPILSDHTVNATPLKPSNTKFSWANRADYIAEDKIGTEMFASFLFEDLTFDITGNNDMVKVGFSVRNSESGKGAFSISPFTWRNSCDNRMYHLANERILGRSGIEILQATPDLVAKKEQIKKAKEQYSEVLRGFKKPHTKSIKIDLIKEAIQSVRLGAEQVVNRYKEMYRLKVQKVQAQQIARRMPKFVLDELSWLEISKKGKILESYDKDISQWDALNDITKVLTHKGKSFAPTMRQFKTIDEILVAQKVIAK